MKTKTIIYKRIEIEKVGNEYQTSAWNIGRYGNLNEIKKQITYKLIEEQKLKSQLVANRLRLGITRG
jgi:hypothetical protein